MLQRTQQRHIMLSNSPPRPKAGAGGAGEEELAPLLVPSTPKQRALSKFERTHEFREKMKRGLKDRSDSLFTMAMLAILTLSTGVVFTQLFAVAGGEGGRSAGALVEIGEIDGESRSLDDDVGGENDISAILGFNLGDKMREWMAKKQLVDGYFFTTPKSEDSVAKPYTAKEIVATIPHFSKELLLVMYAAATDEFIVLLPGRKDRPPPKCEGGCVRIQNILHTILYAFRNRYPQRFQKGQSEDFLFLVSTGDTPRLTKDCIERPGGCGRRKKFAPILHFGSGFSDDSFVPSLIVMPPPPRMHLRCMSVWQISHEVCEYLEPKRVLKDGRETPGLVFGEHVNYNVEGANVRGDKKDGIVWEDLIPQLVWRGTDFNYLASLNPDMRPPKYSEDVAPKLKEYSKGQGGVIRALNDVWDILRPRWKAVVLTARAEFEAETIMNNPKRESEKKVLPWADMKFSQVATDHVKRDIADDPYYTQWNNIGIPAAGNYMTSEELALYKYHIDLGGGGGTTWEGTLQKLAMPGALFHHETSARDWYHEHMVPWVHYIPVKEDLSDLKEQFDWAMRHDRKVRDIAKAGTDFVRRMGRPEGLDELYRRHFLKPLEDVIDAYQQMEEMPPEFTDGGESGMIFKEVMRCSGYRIDEECPLLRD